MPTKKVKNRILFLIVAASIFLLFIFFVLKTLNKNLLYFSTPTDVIKNDSLMIGKKMRLGGMVKKNSILVNKKEIKFIITDYNNEIIVSFKGSVPNLFSEEKGVIAEGELKDKKFFIASRILAKHDENYMPPELKEVIKNNVK
ncbi:cytochrome c maturation protein CcmE [Pelagibacteraceae bacterium]|jgi:cytochrome c-type biogenesis protein CcmE|nr:cytochrome c maturation protein CcmE [Pelagibacteraceae bacterium]|tara:strand:- start:919 stop:1347 length:429 start_codon:yes stop_codon:yes gene_type:complete